MRFSVIIKTLNEQRNIARTLESALAAVQAAGGGEVIVADSLSTDATVQIAAGYPVRIVQLVSAEDRCCGVGAQLGYAVAQGQYLYILDGDMTFEAGFLAAAADALDADAGLAGVGGKVREMNLANEEFVNRAGRNSPHLQAGPVDRLDGGGLYRRSALQDVGYFTNQNLHAYEEFELAARLAAKGWRLQRLDRPGICHFGHTDSSFRLLARRWHSRYAWGVGELVRASWGEPHWGFVVKRLRALRVYAAVLLWLLAWVVLVVLGALLQRPAVAAAGLLLLAMPFGWMAWRRQSATNGVYAVAAWLVFAGGLVVGALTPPRRRPTDPVRFAQLK